jgi:peptide/nickel transport system substrate-binding protein
MTAAATTEPVGSSASPTTASASGTATASGTTAGAAAKPGGTLNWALPNEAATLDPHVSSSRYDYQIESHLFDTLVVRDPSGAPAPSLATKWESNTDGTEWTFSLRSGVKFHDGTTFSADAVKFNFDRMVSPDTKSEQAKYNLGPYDSTEAVDDSTAKVTLKSPFAPLLLGLAEYTMGMVSPEAAQKSGKDFGRNPVGTGPFKFKEWVAKDHITIVKNADYQWAPATFSHNGAPYLDSIVTRFIKEDETRVAALTSAQVDLIMPTPDTHVADMKKNKDFKVDSTVVQGFPPSLMFNVQKAPTDDVQVRQALSYGIDRDGIIKAVYSGSQQPAKGIWKSDSPYYWDGANGWYPYDADKAESMLDAAGWKKGSDGNRAKDGQQLKIVYLTLPGQIQGIAELVQAQMQEYGVKVDILTEDNPAQQQDAQKGVHNIVWLNWLLADPYGLDTLFGSENAGPGWNFSQFKDPNVDTLLEQGVSETDRAKRIEIYDKVQQTIYEQAAVYPINYLTRNWTHRTFVEGIKVGPDGEWVHFYDTWLNK